MLEYRRGLVRKHKGDSDRDIANARQIGRGKLKSVRQAALARSQSALAGTTPSLRGNSGGSQRQW